MYYADPSVVSRPYNNPRSGFRSAVPEVLGTYVFWSDDHVDNQNAVLGEAHRQINIRVYDRARSFSPRYVFLGGDMTELGDQSEMDSLRAHLGDLDAIAYKVPGNHEGFNGNNYIPYRSLAKSGESNYQMAWRIDDSQAGVRIIGGFSGYVQGDDDAYFAWLEEQLSSTPVGYGVMYIQHHPPYSRVKRGGAQVIAQGRLADLLRTYKVALVLTGHSHYFEVYCPSLGDPFYYVSGCAGMELSELLTALDPMYAFFEVSMAEKTHGLVRIEVTRDDLRIVAETVESPMGPAGVILDERTIPLDRCLVRGQPQPIVDP
jgi:hypothetical protein